MPFFLVVFLFFSCVANSAPLSPNPDETQQTTIDEKGEPVHDQTVIISAPQDGSYLNKFKRSQSEEKEYFYTYKQSISPRIGVLVFDTDELFFLFGFHYMLASNNSPWHEIGTDLVSNGTGNFNWCYKWVFFETTRTRPFVKAGANLKLDPSLGLSNFVALQNYSLKIAIGIEDMLADPLSGRIDLEGLIGMSGYNYSLVLGYSWAW